MTIKDRYSGIQSILSDCGDNGCHFLTLLTIIEEKNRETNPNYTVDLIDAIRISQSKGWFKPDFEGRDATALLSYYTGKRWTRRKVDKLPATIKDNEFTECNWYNEATKKEHFTRRYVDTIIDSFTVKYGKIRYYYIYTCEG